MTIIVNAPTSEQVLAKLDEDGGESTILAEVERAPFKAQISRYDGHDGEEFFTDLPRIEIDCSDQDGGEMFVDLTILPDYVETFAEVVNEIVSDYRAIGSRCKLLARNESEIRTSADYRESL
ncbi:hypothetical protein G9444_6416 [Rhodococcus erythropolis]|uniref:Uncharacterized protein n=1 Tax=Rhodococcus erythropolis TaxID=1833 RepID=A0A6G9D399_RHOER|nr:hypothetical protein [Rhodococcus erythropolis]QIP43659.1 hypothetical protein G9444_6416 [Rhodococcus erythropolis]